MSPYICNSCKTISKPVLDSQGGWNYELQPSFQVLRQSAERGCISCRIFRDRLEAIIWDRTICKLPYDAPVVLRTFSGSAYVRYGPNSAFVGIVHESLQRLLPGKYIGPTVDCDKNLIIMRSLIRNCLKCHDCSYTPTLSNASPTRLLDLGNDPDVLNLRIVSGTECQSSQEQYMTLSHCWGVIPDEVPWRLTQSRLSAYTEQLPLDILPKTFREAVQLTKKIGIRYLWIDSLCIMQDSLEDWVCESAIMSDIYIGSFCTISAASNSTEGGLFFPRTADKVSPVNISCSRFGGASENVKLFPELPCRKDLEQKLTVNQRAWCLQEHELSPRVIQFTSHSWLWNCKSLETEEGALFGYFAEEGSISEQLASPLKIRNSNIFAPAPSCMEAGDPWPLSHMFLGYWYNILEQFTSRAITYTSDRLPALEGLKKRQFQWRPDVYLYGLWESDLLIGLQWQATSLWDTRQGGRPVSKIAPSWSPLCLNAPIHYSSFIRGKHEVSETSKLCPKISVASTLSNQDAGLLVQGYLLESDWEEYDKRPEHQRAYDFTVGDRLMVYNNNGDTEQWGKIYWDTLADRNSCSRVSCFFIHEGSWDYPESSGLALVPTSANKRVFTRVGIVTEMNIDMFDDIKPIEFTII